MASFCMNTGVAFIVLIGHFISSSEAAGFSYPFSFFNVSTDRADVGFVQMFACTLNESTIFLQAVAGNLTRYQLLKSTRPLNLTIPYDELQFTTAEASTPVFRLNGVVLSADSQTAVYGVKSDIGTTDGFLVYPLTKQSTEFIIAGWSVKNTRFFASIQIVAGLDDTCVSVFAINPDGSLGTRSSAYLYGALGLYDYPVDDGFDTSAIYLNSSRPITVLSGVSCGNVFLDNLFCDHMVEAMPPISEHGTTHVVPPIMGRTATAGYLVRVFSSKPSTDVTWTDVFGVETIGTAYFGRPYEIDTTDASQPILIVCDTPCLVMQYNKGKIYDTQSNTDPFTMIITPVDHYSHGSCYATASFCISSTEYIDFFNYLAVATATVNKQAILFNDQPITMIGSWVEIGDFSVIAGSVPAGFHNVTTVGGSPATFGGWVYGHSSTSASTSGYGYPITYTMFGEPVTSTWQQALDNMATVTKASLAGTCLQQAITNGSVITSYSPSNISATWTVYNTFQLNATLKAPLPIDSTCQTSYTIALRGYLQTTFSYINYQICTRSMCPYVTGIGGAPISSGNMTAGINPTVMSVAIDTANLDDNIKLDISNNIMSGVRLTVPYVGFFDINVEKFTECQTEILNFLVPFVNWMTINNNGYVPANTSSLSTNQTSLTQQQKQMLENNQLFAAPASCDPLSFELLKFGYATPSACPSVFG